MNDNDLISRVAAIDALTDKNIEKNFDSVYDGELHRTKRAAMRIIANMPTVDAIPVEWLKDKMQKPQMTDGNPFGFVLAEWLEEQEAK